MKISNSKKQLAEIIHENGGWREEAEHSVSSCNGTIVFSKSKPRYTSKYGWTVNGGFICDRIEQLPRLKNWHQTILSRDEYFHLYPAPDADGWVDRIKSELQVDGLSVVDVRFRDGETHFGPSHVFDWSVDGGEDDIIAYRLHKPEPEIQSEIMGIAQVGDINVVESKPTIEQLAADYHNRKDYADRKQQEADDAKADADTKLAELVEAGKSIGLVLSVEPEGSVITPAQPQLIAGDLRSWRQWEVGDLISWSIVGHTGEFKIIAVHHDPSRSIGDFEVEDKHGGVYRVYDNECRFIRRP